jgi:IS5 family transposase
MVRIQEAENQIITAYEVHDKRPNDADLLVPAVELHQQQFGNQGRAFARTRGRGCDTAGRRTL